MHIFETHLAPLAHLANTHAFTEKKKIRIISRPIADISRRSLTSRSRTPSRKGAREKESALLSYTHTHTQSVYIKNPHNEACLSLWFQVRSGARRRESWSRSPRSWFRRSPKRDSPSWWTMAFPTARYTYTYIYAERMLKRLRPHRSGPSGCARVGWLPWKRGKRRERERGYRCAAAMEEWVSCVGCSRNCCFICMNYNSVEIGASCSFLDRFEAFWL